jgi:hypothetical protein
MKYIKLLFLIIIIPFYSKKSFSNNILIAHYDVIKELLKTSTSSGEIVISDNKFNILGKVKNSL